MGAARQAKTAVEKTAWMRDQLEVVAKLEVVARMEILARLVAAVMEAVERVAVTQSEETREAVLELRRQKMQRQISASVKDATTSDTRVKAITSTVAETAGMESRMENYARKAEKVQRARQV